jgi:hypothetical protein
MYTFWLVVILYSTVTFCLLTSRHGIVQNPFPEDKNYACYTTGCRPQSGKSYYNFLCTSFII